MAYRSARSLPPRGSTGWGAQQFLRVLDEEERVAAERERLLAVGWRPPTNLDSYRYAPAILDERAYAELIERDLANRRALEDEARRRAIRSVASGGGRDGTGGRYGLPLPTDRANGAPFVQPISLTNQADAEIPGRSASTHPQIANAALLAEGLAWRLGLGAAGAAGAAVAEGGTQIGGQTGDSRYRDFGWSLEDLWPPYVSSPEGVDPGATDDLTDPLPGYPNQSDELRHLGRPAEPPPLPEDPTRQPQLPPLSQTRPEPLVRVSLQQVLDRFTEAGILIRAESDSTRQDNEDIIKITMDTMASCGWTAEHVAGAAKTERHLPNEEYAGTGGDRYLDGSVEGTAPDGRKVLYDFNTAEQLKRATEGRRWVAYERRAEDAIRLLKQKIDRLLKTRFDVYPKSRGMDRELWRESVRPYVQEAVRALLDC